METKIADVKRVIIFAFISLFWVCCSSPADNTDSGNNNNNDSGDGNGKTITYSIAFDSNGGSSIDTIDGISYNTNISLPTAPVREGYTFSGWFFDNNTFNNELTASTLITKSAVVYAKWNRIITNVYYYLGWNSNFTGNTFTGFGIILYLDTDIPNIDISNITVDGNGTGTLKVSLKKFTTYSISSPMPSGVAYRYEISVINVVHDGYVTVSILKDGYNFIPFEIGSDSVQVNRDKTPPPF
jgi:uncharacterized repeat protein (TIGR02543 family)